MNIEKNIFGYDIAFAQGWHVTGGFEVEVRIRTLTPIWTGDIGGKCTRLRETSIIGSLRWWFEAIVRGLGGYACDSVSDRCEYKNTTEDICAVCELFGTTGWAKRFRFKINQGFSQIYDECLVISGGSRSWFYPSGLVNCDGSNTLEQVLPFGFRRNIGGFNQENDLAEQIFNVLLAFISNWGMIGGKTSVGYGVVGFEDENGNPLKPSKEDIDEFIAYLNEKRNHGKSVANVPRLDEMFFAKLEIKDECVDRVIKRVRESIRKKNNKKQFPNLMSKRNGAKEKINDDGEFLQNLVDNYGFIPTSALVRKTLRSEIRIYFSNNHRLRHFLMGNVQTNKKFVDVDPTRFSAIQVSHIYRNGGHWEFKIWGWLPERIEKICGVEREKIIQFVENKFNDGGFWMKVFGCGLRRPDGKTYIVKYPQDNWNFIDFSAFRNNEKFETFREMVTGHE